MTNVKDIIIQLKKVREEKGLSYNDILDLMELNGDYLSKSTLSRVFAEGSEEVSFRYEETIRPIANALLDIQRIEADDTPEMQAMKTLIQKNERMIEGLQQQITELKLQADEDKLRAHEKMEHEREAWGRSIEFLKEQISLKDKRMDQLMDAVFKRDSHHRELLDIILSCPARKQTECDI